MKPVRYDEDADEELIEEIARYELRREGLGIEFLTAVREAVRLITQNPGAWQASEHAPDVRRFVNGAVPVPSPDTERPRVGSAPMRGHARIRIGCRLLECGASSCSPSRHAAE
jgi:hypothetical protein